MGITLSIAHNLYLTREQRYDWHQGKELTVIGVSVPVWFHGGVTSEPAAEVFSKYKLYAGDHIFITHNKEGYEITIPPEPLAVPQFPPDDIWNKLSKEEQEKWHNENEHQPSVKSLLDVKDGGSAWLAFRQYNKVKKNKKFLHVIHFVEIKDMEVLIETLA